jgi:hypothetical protein
MSRKKVGGLLVAGVAMWWSCVGETAREAEKVIAGAKPPTIQTSICAVASNPVAFYDKNILVYGCLSSDGIERNGLIDEACPHTGISVSESEKLSPEQRTILRGIGRRGAGQLCGMFSGTFRASTRLGNVIVNTDILEVASVRPTTDRDGVR